MCRRRYWYTVSRQEAVISGPGSPDWKKALIRLADRFIAVVNEAEAEAERTKEATVVADSAPRASDAAQQREFGDTLRAVHNGIDEVRERTASFDRSMRAALMESELVNMPAMFSGTNLNLSLHRMAKQLDARGRGIKEEGIRFRDLTSQLDLQVRQLARLGTADPEYRLEADVSLNSVNIALADLDKTRWFAEGGV